MTAPVNHKVLGAASQTGLPLDRPRSDGTVLVSTRPTNRRLADLMDRLSAVGPTPRRFEIE